MNSMVGVCFQTPKPVEQAKGIFMENKQTKLNKAESMIWCWQKFLLPRHLLGMKYINTQIIQKILGVL